MVFLMAEGIGPGRPLDLRYLLVTDQAGCRPESAPREKDEGVTRGAHLQSAERGLLRTVGY